MRAIVATGRGGSKEAFMNDGKEERTMTRSEMRQVAAMVVRELRGEIERLAAAQAREHSDELLPVGKVMELSGMSKSFCYKNWTEMGGLKMGKKLVIPRSSLDYWMRSRIAP